ncbi:MAG: hypothetical protein O2910_05140 [Proteobacteria bacterium]|nr:hypothetical protein [Pseudomonadota bacterium]
MVVSFDKDITSFFASTQFNGGIALEKEDTAKVTFTSSSVITDRSLFFDVDDSGDGNFTGADLDALTILEDGSVIASFASTVSGILDQDVHLLSSAGVGIEGSTITTSTLFLNNTGVNTNVNLTGLFETSIPAPGTVMLSGLGIVVPLWVRIRSRRRLQRA